MIWATVTAIGVSGVDAESLAEEINTAIVEIPESDRIEILFSHYGQLVECAAQALILHGTPAPLAATVDVEKTGVLYREVLR